MAYGDPYVGGGNYGEPPTIYPQTPVSGGKGDPYMGNPYDIQPAIYPQNSSSGGKGDPYMGNPYDIQPTIYPQNPTTPEYNPSPGNPATQSGQPAYQPTPYVPYPTIGTYSGGNSGNAYGEGYPQPGGARSGGGYTGGGSTGGYTPGGSYAPQTGYKPNDPNNPGSYAPTGQPTTKQAIIPAGPGGPGGGGGAPNWADLLKQDNTVPLRALDIQEHYNNWLMQTWMPQQYELQKALQVADQTGDYNGVETLTKQLQMWQEKLGEQQNYVNTVTQMGNLTGMVGNQPTMQFQNLQNQYALAGGNLGLGARGQDLQALQANLGYANNLQDMIGQYGTNLGQQGVALKGLESQYGLGQQQNLGQYGTGLGTQLSGMLGAQANYGVQMQQLQNQMAQSPLVAWYTARGLPPPQSAVQAMSQPAPDWSRFENQAANQQQGIYGGLMNPNNPNFGTTATMDEQRGYGDALMNQIGAPEQRGLDPFQQPTFNWSQQPTSIVNRQGYTPPADTRGLYNNLMEGYKAWRGANQGAAWNETAFAGVAAQNGIPAPVAQLLWQGAQQAPGGQMSTEVFQGLLAQAVDAHNNQNGGGPFGAIQVGNTPAALAPQQWTPPGTPSNLYGQLVDGFKSWRQANPNAAWNQSTFTGIAAQQGIPANIAGKMWQLAQKTPGGQMDPSTFMGILSQAANLYGGNQGSQGYQLGSPVQ